MTSTESRVASFLEISFVLAEAELEKGDKTMFRAFPVIIGIHGADEGITTHKFIKSGSDALETFRSYFSPNLFLVHPAMQTEAFFRKAEAKKLSNRFLAN